MEVCVLGGWGGGGGANKEDATYDRANKEHRVTGSKHKRVQKNAYLL